MAIDEIKSNMQKTNVIQNLILESREKLSVSGTIDVLSFDDQIVIIQTHLGLLTIKGDDLRINKLSIESEDVIIEGNIVSMAYSNKSFDKKEAGFLNKIFK